MFACPRNASLPAAKSVKRPLWTVRSAKSIAQEEEDISDWESSYGVSKCKSAGVLPFRNWMAQKYTMFSISGVVWSDMHENVDGRKDGDERLRKRRRPICRTL
jgi:hypothetical protein